MDSDDPSPSLPSSSNGASASHVFLPHHSQNRWKHIQPLLRLVESGLVKDASDLQQLLIENATFSVSRSSRFKPKFSALPDMFDQLTQKMSQTFFEDILPFMGKVAGELPILFPEPFPFLRAGVHGRVTISKRQAACLIANGFFCTIPRQHESLNLPNLNFFQFFSGRNPEQSQKAKFICILNYFNQISNDLPDLQLCFIRNVLQPPVPSSDHWLNQTMPLIPILFRTDGTIEDDGRGMLQADFANEYLGGGVLSHGAVQEEIRFVINPELCASMLFTERMEDNEAVVMIGCEQYSAYKGYGSSLAFNGVVKDDTPIDARGRKDIQITAFDAVKYGSRDKRSQFKVDQMLRELNKAYIAFCGDPDEREDIEKQTFPPGNATPSLRAVATGNWGCGVFNGDPELKSMIQWMAATCARRQMVYFSFGEKRIVRLPTVAATLMGLGVSVAELWAALLEYSESLFAEQMDVDYRNDMDESSTGTLFDFLLSKFTQDLVASSGDLSQTY